MNPNSTAPMFARYNVLLDVVAQIQRRVKGDMTEIGRQVRLACNRAVNSDTTLANELKATRARQMDEIVRVLLEVPADRPTKKAAATKTATARPRIDPVGTVATPPRRRRASRPRAGGGK